MKKQVFFDMHTHSESSHDSVCPVSDMKKSAKEKGISGFAVTDHCDIEYYDTIDLHRCVEKTFEGVENSKDDEIKIFKGIEIGEGFWHPEITEEILKNYKFDVVIGSVHAVKYPGYEMPYSQIDFSKMGKKTAEKYFDKYFDDVIYMIENCEFDVLAHLTCPLRYINGKYNLGLKSDMYTEKIEKILDRIIEKSIALEVNTSCVFDGSGYNEFLPSEDIIKMYKEKGGHLITVGSDAHIKENCGNNFEKLFAILKTIGFENAYYYEKRKPIPYPIV